MYHSKFTPCSWKILLAVGHVRRCCITSSSPSWYFPSSVFGQDFSTISDTSFPNLLKSRFLRFSSKCFSDPLWVVKTRMTLNSHICVCEKCFSFTFKEMDKISTWHTGVTASNAQFSKEVINNGNLEFKSSTWLK